MIGVQMVLIIIIIIAGIALYISTRNKNQVVPNQKQMLPPLKKDMTLQELSRYDGVQNQRILVALKGVIFDVTQSEFYGPDGPYGIFSGHDASVNLAKMSHEKDLLNAYFKQYQLKKDQESVLSDWYSRFSTKYPIVGNVIT